MERKTSSPAERTDYDLTRAKESVSQMSETGYSALVRALLSPGDVLDLRYPGIGSPPQTPGGDIRYSPRRSFKDVLAVVRELAGASGNGHVVNVTGTKGIGKSCHLRALAWVMILSDQKVIGLWNLADAYSDLLPALVAALRFTYCNDDAVLDQIDGLTSLQDVEAFVKARVASGECLYLIVDGAQVDTTVTHTGVPRHDRDELQAVDMYLQMLAQIAHVTVYGLSPAADNSRKRKAEGTWIQMQDCFLKDEYEAYVNQVSIILGKLSRWQDDIDYYADNHPLSLSILDACCRQWAKERKRLDDASGTAKLTRLLSPWSTAGSHGSYPTDDEIVTLLEDRCEWEEVLQLFVSSPEMSSMRILLGETLKGLDTEFHSPSSMMKRDMRFVVGDPDRGGEYATPYINRLYVEGFRDAEGKSSSQGAAWSRI